MECKYYKYTIIELVPFEIKSHKTPLYTIVNSLLLWAWLIFYFVYENVSAIFSKRKSFKRIYENKYKHKSKANEKTSRLTKEETLIEEIDRGVFSDNMDNLVGISTEHFNSKYAYKILKTLVEEDKIDILNIKEEDISKLGKFVLRKDTIFVDSQDCESISEKVILTRAISKPVQIFLDFMFKKII